MMEGVAESTDMGFVPNIPRRALSVYVPRSSTEPPARSYLKRMSSGGNMTSGMAAFASALMMSEGSNNERKVLHAGWNW